MGQKLELIENFGGKKIVIIKDILFRNKKHVEWKDVKEYLRKYVGDVYEIISTSESIYIGSDFPNEYTGSDYTYSLKGANAKAKANAVSEIPQIIEYAVGGNHKANTKERHRHNAKYGWYRYDSYFAIPIFNNLGVIKYYNVFHCSLLIRHADDGKKYLYDIIDIKKETSYPIEP